MKPRARMIDSGAQRKRLANVDLAFNPDQPRDWDGRWVKVPTYKRLEIPSDEVLERANEVRRIPDEQYRAATLGYFMDGFSDSALDDELFEDFPGAQGWALYQMPIYYEEIQMYLREDRPPMWADTTMAYNTADLDKAFDKLGVTLDEPMTVYRGVAPHPHGPTPSELDVGDTYVEKGVSSTSENPDMVSSFLDSQFAQEENEEVIEIELPVGMRVLGGAGETEDGEPFGSELMLPPGTRFEVLEHFTAWLSDFTGESDGKELPGTRVRVVLP